MDARFRPVALAELVPEITAHLVAQPGRIEAFLEDHIRRSNHYRIVVDGGEAGLASIHGGNLIVGFALHPEFRALGQQVYRELRRTEQVTSAFVPTCDEFYLAHALDGFRLLAKQAYFFAERPDLAPLPDPAVFRQTPVAPADAAMIRARTGDFFDPLDERIARAELFFTWRGDEIAGIGIIERSSFHPDIASVGMFTLQPFRNQGVGVATIRFMIEAAHREGRRAVAGCWYYNHASKRTLERAGLHSPTRLLRVEY